MIHFINVYSSIKIDEMIRKKHPNSDQCSWYFTTFLIDLFPGLLLIFLFSTLLENLFLKCDCYSLVPGNYVSERNEVIVILKWSYTKQILIWILVLLVSKGLLLLMYIPLIEIIGKFSSWSLSFLRFSVDFKLFFVLIMFPLVVNVLLFWISDNLLKKKHWSKEETTLRKSFYTIDENEEIQHRYSNLKVLGHGLIKGSHKS